MKKYQKIISGIAAVTIVLSCIAGCGKKETVQNSTGSDNKWKAGDGTILDWFINLSYWDAPAGLWETAEVLKEISEITGVKPNVSIPTGSGLEKVNIMMATGDMPDLMTFESGEAQINQMVKNKAIYPLEELIEKYCPEMKEEIPEYVWTYGASSADGVLYGLPSFLKSDWQVAEHDDMNTATYNVRSDIYEELGSPDMSTPDGFYNALLAFKEKYPEINGKKTIPLCLYPSFWSAGYLEKAFGIYDAYIDDEGNYYQYWRNPKYEEFLKYMVKLNKAGLTDSEAYVKKQDQVEEDLAQGLSFVVLWKFDGLYGVNSALQKMYPDARYKAIEPMSATGERTMLSRANRSGWTTTFIPRESKHPEEALKFMRYLWNEEGDLLMNYGHEGEDWIRIDDHTIQRTDSYAERSKQADFKERTGIFTYRVFHHQWNKVLPAPNVEQPESETEDRVLANELADTNYMYLSLMRKPDPDSEEGLIKTQADTLISKYKAKFLTATDEETAITEYRNMVNELDALGYGKVDKFNTEAHKDAKERASKLSQGQ